MSDTSLCTGRKEIYNFYESILARTFCGSLFYVRHYLVVPIGGASDLFSATACGQFDNFCQHQNGTEKLYRSEFRHNLVLRIVDAHGNDDDLQPKISILNEVFCATNFSIIGDKTANFFNVHHETGENIAAYETSEPPQANMTLPASTSNPNKSLGKIHSVHATAADQQGDEELRKMSNEALISELRKQLRDFNIIDITRPKPANGRYYFFINFPTEEICDKVRELSIAIRGITLRFSSTNQRNKPNGSAYRQKQGRSAAGEGYSGKRGNKYTDTVDSHSVADDMATRPTDGKAYSRYQANEQTGK